jgi:predicted nuclease of predicted toxin-antitoxin system
LRILVDECLPEDLVGWLPEWDLRMVQQMGWTGVKNGELLRRAEREFDLFLTADKNLRYQQNLKGRRLAILALPSNRLKVLRRMTADIEAAIAQIIPGQADQYSETKRASKVFSSPRVAGPPAMRGSSVAIDQTRPGLILAIIRLW